MNAFEDYTYGRCAFPQQLMRGVLQALENGASPGDAQTLRRALQKRLAQILRYADAETDDATADVSEENQESELEAITRAIAHLCGKEAAPPVRHRLRLPRTGVELAWRDSTFVEADIGGQTWPSALVFAAMLDGEPALARCWARQFSLCVELGTGTGLAGVALARLLAGAAQTIVLTDYHASALQAAARNASDGLPPEQRARVHTCPLDFVRFGEADAAALRPHLARSERAALLFGTDLLYELAHAAQLPATVAQLLRMHCRPQQCRFALMVPLRERFAAEIRCFLQRAPECGLLLESERLLAWDDEKRSISDADCPAPLSAYALDADAGRLERELLGRSLFAFLTLRLSESELE